MNAPFVLIAFAFCVGLFFGLKRLYEYDPRAGDYSIAYEQIGGLMVLPMIGLVLTPIRAGSDLLKGNYFEITSWRILTDSAYGTYDPSRGTLVLLELILLVFMVGGSIFLLILMVKRRTSFPGLMCWFLGIRAGFLLLQSLWISALESKQPMDMFSGLYLLVLILWILYFYYADRVKGTFRERLERK